ncbi:DnaB-like helicase C-terminal domain-containing protein [Salinicoccus carnicancri]|uniref:DnaB-like helicase C-terminal domain-containing protein n=1 Tax=Salinicoccus carnicancri TaxID=558170 RepID=UPI0002EE7749|nr:DnaB-like helicase C-terminal domain-containing protein [Salinicoccus carnicancri]
MNEIANFTDVEYFEKTVLAKALLFPELRKQLRLLPEYFDDNRHGAIANKLQSDLAFDKHQLISEAVKLPEVYGNYDFVSQIAFLDIPTDKGFIGDQEQVLKHYKHREIAKTMDAYTQDPSFDNSMAMRNKIDHLEQIDLEQGDKKLDTLAQVFDSLYEENATTIIKTGIDAVDNLISFEPAQVNIIAGRPSMGKTALALQMALNVADETTQVIFFSLETSEIKLTHRILSNMSGVHLEKFKQPSKSMTNEDIDKVIAAIEIYHGANIKIIDDARVSPNHIRAEANNIPEGMNGVIFIDYLTLMKSDNKHHDKRQEVEEISRELKIIAKEQNVTINALSQLSRGPESRQDKRPLMSDLRESGQVEQDADIVALCYRDDYYLRDEEENPSEGSQLEVIISKNKDGATGTALTQFFKTTQRIFTG